MKIIIIPIGDIDQEVLDQLKLSLGKTFASKVKVNPQIGQPTYAYNRAIKQYHSTIILSVIKALHFDGEGLGVVNVDLYAPGLNFVFGEASPEARVGVISLYRLRPELYGFPRDENLFTQRAIKEAIHELGHIYGLRHCNNPKCVMHFSNTLKDTDIKQAAFCGKCCVELKGEGIISRG